jgi:xanthine dehydrogenase small subunit
MVKAHGSQCGFCTPGFIMTMTALAQKAKNKQTLNEQTIKNALTGNLCRCTGYDTIIDAAKNINLNIFNSLYEKYPVKTNNSPENILINHNNYQFHAPSNIKQALNWLQENSQATILGSVTDLGVLANKNQKPLNNILSLQNIPELYLITRDQQNITIGARVSLSSLRKFIQNLIPELARFLNIFASPQIKNMATLIGNIANASPIADMPPFLLVTQAELSLVSSSNKRKVILENFYLAYKKIDLQPGEIITHISFKIPSAQEYLRLYKISQRKDLDISTVNAAFCCELDTTQDFPIITKARIAFGGVADRSIRLMQTENFLKNQKLSPNLISQAKIISQNEIKPLDDLRGSANYRRVLVNAIIDRYFQEIMGKGRT